MKYLYLLITGAMLVLSCGQDTEKKLEENAISEQQLEERRAMIQTMMNLHDEAMEKMEQLNAKREELSTLKTNIKDSEILTHVQTVESRVAEAEEMMMKWMREYEEPAKDTPQEKAIQYIEQKRFEIQEVHARMLEGLHILDDAIARSK